MQLGSIFLHVFSVFLIPVYSNSLSVAQVTQPIKRQLWFTLILIVSQPPAPDEEVEQSTGLFDGSSDMFLMALMSLLAILGVAVMAGLVYQYLIFVPRKKKGKTEL